MSTPSSEHTMLRANTAIRHSTPPALQRGAEKPFPLPPRRHIHSQRAHGCRAPKKVCGFTVLNSHVRME